MENFRLKNGAYNIVPVFYDGENKSDMYSQTRSFWLSAENHFLYAIKKYIIPQFKQ